MAMVDLLYSDNPKKREKVVRLSTKLYTLLESNFKRVNELIDCIHTYMPGKRFSRIKMDDRDTIRNNCKVIQGRMEEIETYMGQKMREVKASIDRSVFDKLMDTDTKFIDRVRLARKVWKGAKLVGWTARGLVLLYYIGKAAIFSGISVTLFVISASIIAMLKLGVLILVADLLISAILGAIERKKLDEAIKELEDAIRTFEPASDKFNRAVERLIIRMEDAFDD